MFPIDEASIWERRDRVLSAQKAYEDALPIDRALAALNLIQVAVASADDVPRLLDTLVQVYGDLLSERHAIGETVDAAVDKIAGEVWARVAERAPQEQRFDRAAGPKAEWLTDIGEW